MRRSRHPAAESSAASSSVLPALWLTLAAQVVVGAGTLLFFRLLALTAGVEAFASFSLVRQAVVLLFPVVTVGLVGGLPRYIALGRGSSAPAAESYLAAAVGISGAAAIVAATAAVVFPRATASLFFGDADATDLVVPFSALLLATAAFYVAYGYFRGQQRFAYGSALQIAGFAIVPPLLIGLWPGISVDTLVLLMAATLATMSVGSVIGAFVRGAVGRERGSVQAAGRSLLDYGIRRVPGEIAQVGLFALVLVLGAHLGTLRDVAYLAAGLQVLAVISMAMTPVGIVLLPALAQTWMLDRVAALRQVATLSALALHVSLFASAQAVLFADVAVRAWLGPAFDDAGTTVAVVVLAVPFYVYYLALRSALDAVAVRSYNSRSNIAALIVFAAVTVVTLATDLMPAGLCVAAAFTAGAATQGIATFVFVRRVFTVALSDYALWIALPLSGLTATAGFAVHPFIEEADSLWLLVGLELVFGSFYIAGLVRWRVAWTQMVLERFFVKSRFQSLRG